MAETFGGCRQKKRFHSEVALWLTPCRMPDTFRRLPARLRTLMAGCHGMLESAVSHSVLFLSNLGPGSHLNGNTEKGSIGDRIPNRNPKRYSRSYLDLKAQTDDYLTGINAILKVWLNKSGLVLMSFSLMVPRARSIRPYLMPVRPLHGGL